MAIKAPDKGKMSKMETSSSEIITSQNSKSDILPPIYSPIHTHTSITLFETGVSEANIRPPSRQHSPKMSLSRLPSASRDSNSSTALTSSTLKKLPPPLPSNLLEISSPSSPVLPTPPAPPLPPTITTSTTSKMPLLVSTGPSPTKLNSHETPPSAIPKAKVATKTQDKPKPAKQSYLSGDSPNDLDPRLNFGYYPETSVDLKNLLSRNQLRKLTLSLGISRLANTTSIQNQPDYYNQEINKTHHKKNLPPPFHPSSPLPSTSPSPQDVSKIENIEIPHKIIPENATNFSKEINQNLCLKPKQPLQDVFLLPQQAEASSNFTIGEHEAFLGVGENKIIKDAPHKGDRGVIDKDYTHTDEMQRKHVNMDSKLTLQTFERSKIDTTSDTFNETHRVDLKRIALENPPQKTEPIQSHTSPFKTHESFSLPEKPLLPSQSFSCSLKTLLSQNINSVLHLLPEQNTVVINENDTISEFLELLHIHCLRSCVVQHNSKSFYCTPKCFFSFVDVRDFLYYTILMHQSLKNKSFSEILNLIKEEKIGTIANISKRSPFVRHDVSDTVAHLCAAFKPCCRVPIFDKKRLVRVLSPADMLLILNSSNVIKEIEANTSISIKSTAQGPIIKLRQSESLLKAMVLMERYKYSALPIVSDRDENNILEVITVREIKYIFLTRDTLQHGDIINEPAFKFVSYLRRNHYLHSEAYARLPETASFQEMINVFLGKMFKNTQPVHRIFLLDDNGKMTQMVSLTNVMHNLADLLGKFYRVPSATQLPHTHPAHNRN